MMNLTSKFLIFCTLLTVSLNSYGQEGEVLKGAAGSVVTGGVKGAAMNKAGTAAVDAISPGTSESIGKFMSSPLGIMIVSSIGGLNAGVLYNAAKQQEDESEANIRKIDKILTSYKDSWQGFCPNGREVLAEPSCYCYLASGKQNTNRSNSKTCTDLWAKNNSILATANGAYSGISAFVDPVGCVTVNGQFDENCRCKKMLNSKGENACKKSVSLNTSTNVLGPGYVLSSGMNKVMQNLASTTSGASNLGSLSDRMLKLAIAKQGDLNNGIFQKIYSDPNKKSFPQINSVNDLVKLQGAVFKKKEMAELSKAFGTTSAYSSSNSVMPDEKAKILNAVKNKVGLELEGGKGLGNKADEKKPGFDLNFSDSGGPGTGGAQTLDNFPEKTYKYTNSDITTNDSVSIFEIISNRYIQSGLKRLFDDGEAIPAPETK